MQALFPPTDTYATAPAPDELEVTIIGPGFGETALIHIGDNRWITIDSCTVGKDATPAGLRYLNDIGVDPAQVFFMVVSHWDDDHCRGLAELAKACVNAKVGISKAFIKKDFQAYVTIHQQPATRNIRSGVREIRGLMDVLQASGRTSISGAFASKRHYGPADLPGAHGAPTEVWTLSPSDEEYDNFLAWLAGNWPGIGETRRVATPRLRNDLSAVVYVSVGEDVMLFGGDLEEEGRPQTGWSAVLAATGRPQGKAGFFKVAHHGSITGEHPGIWSTLLQDEPLAIIAPFRNGSVSLPRDEDVKRTLSYTGKAFASVNLRNTANPPMANAVQKTIREVARSFTTLRPGLGLVRARKKIGSSEAWRVELFGDATPLAKLR